ncbi:TetR/AcrR family transcriptional regulator [Streptomyces gamaensis]|uniref:TetR/AcrR family transcriptional regulator n=1 Tax=Streptomyces gamaensis TaxID=1763542 RepID=A0ABW0Z128_9ACTN
MSPKSSRAEARRTRAAIVEHGVRLASVEGLEGLTIGRLAADLGMSKSGVLGHFGSKEGLQLAVVDEAAEVFGREVAQRADGTSPGLPRLLALCSAWITYLDGDDVLPGGCFFTAAATEFDDREGPVRDAVTGLSTVWQHDLRRHVRLAVEAGELPGDTDADQLVFELTGQALALHHARRLLRDAAAADRARRAMARLLGHALPSPDRAAPRRTPAAGR